MKSKYTSMYLVVLLILVAGCSPASQGDQLRKTLGSRLGATEEQDSANASASNRNDQSSTSQVVGTVTNVRTNVQAGPLANLKIIVEKSDLGDDDFVKVTDGGKARLEFPGPISLLLYNESEIDSIKAEVDENSNPRIANRLIRGGLSGYVAPGENLTIDLAFGLKVTVLGTNFFVIYDEETGNVTIGKFDGTLFIDLPDQSQIYVNDNEMIDLIWEGRIRDYFYYKIPFTVDQFDETVDSCDIPVQGLNILRRDNSIPLPGDVLVNKSQSLPCESAPVQTLIPVTGCINSYVVQVGVDSVVLRDGPDLRYPNIGEYEMGTQFTITGRYTDFWFFGELPDGKNGWLYYEWLNFPSDEEVDSICKIDSPPTPVVCYKKGTHAGCP